MADETRESWLRLLIDYVRAYFLDKGYELPERIHISVGFPSTGGRAPIEKRKIGESWAPESSTDGAPHIFISPLLSDRMEVAETLVHQLLRIVVGVGAGHRGAFKVAMKTMGLVGKPTSPQAGPELKAILEALLRGMPPYPHPPIILSELKSKKQTTRMLLFQADHTYQGKDGERHCRYSVRTTKKHATCGLPRCPHGEVMQPTDKRKEGEDD